MQGKNHNEHWNTLKSKKNDMATKWNVINLKSSSYSGYDRSSKPNHTAPRCSVAAWFKIMQTIYTAVLSTIMDDVTDYKPKDFVVTVGGVNKVYCTGT